jgi:hypothetical protein
MLKNKVAFKVAVYVPSTLKGNQPAPPELIEKWVRASKIKMAGLFGGFTTLTGQGGWLSDTHGLIEETVTMVRSFTDEEGLKRIGEVKELAKQMAIEMEQEAISVEVAGELNFITA